MTPATKTSATTRALAADVITSFCDAAKKVGFSDNFLGEFRRLCEHEVLGPQVQLWLMPGDTERALSELQTFMRERSNPAQVPGAYRALCLGVGTAFGANPVEDWEFARPREEVLLEAMVALASAKAFYAQPGRVNKLAVVPGDAAEMRTVADEIATLRQLVLTNTRFLQMLLGLLARLETRGAQFVRGYDLVRTVAQRDPELSDLLAAPEVYLYGPAKEGAERRKENDALVRSTQEETEKKLRLEGERKNLVGGELTTFVEGLRRFLGQGDR